MKIGVITYNVPHRKTQDILIRLIGKDVTVIATTFKKRKPVKKLYEHRPTMNTNISTKHICEALGFDYIESDNIDQEIRNLDVTLIGGCGIIDSKDNKIINSHPGHLPHCRGLDALKWAIYNGVPIGVTTHVIDKEVDAGYIIEQEFIEVGFYDTFHSVAIRQYEKEIEMLIRSINQDVSENIQAKYPVNRRMPIELEPIMMQRFENIRRKANQ